MRLPLRKHKKQGEQTPADVRKRLSQLQSPPSNLTRAILSADTQRAQLSYVHGYGPNPLTSAISRFSTWAHGSGYTYQDINDYLTYVLGVKYGTRPRL